MAFKVAVVGATGAVGREIIKTLAERNFPAREVVALASSRSAGQRISYGDDKILTVQSLDSFDFRGVDFGLFSPGASVSAIHAPRAAEAGCIVIDNTSQFRMDQDIPLIVPEVNGPVLDTFVTRKDWRRIIANPNCSTIQMVVALKPLHERFGVQRVVVATYQSVSGAGAEGMDELERMTKASYINDSCPSEVFQKRIAFNVIPQIDRFMPDGATKEEWKMAVETRKILDPDIAVIATCVRVPVFIGHAEAVVVEFANPAPLDQARAALRNAPGVRLFDERDDGGYATPAEIQGEDDVYVSRLRTDPTVPHGLAFWCVADNLRKGAALNAVQIAETLITRNLIGRQAA